jgi:uncharacterized membrane protein YwzB
MIRIKNKNLLQYLKSHVFFHNSFVFTSFLTLDLQPSKMKSFLKSEAVPDLWVLILCVHVVVGNLLYDCRF